MTSLNATNGHVNWSFFTGDELYASPSYADGKIYMMTSQRHIFVLDANNNGAKLASYTTPSGSWSSPTIANSRLYIGNHDWNVYCFANTITATVNSTAGNNLNAPSSTIIIVLIAAILALVGVTLFYFSRKIRKTNKSTAGV